VASKGDQDSNLRIQQDAGHQETNAQTKS